MPTRNERSPGSDGSTSSTQAAFSVTPTGQEHRSRKCSKCGELKSEEKFSWYTREHLRRHPACRRCHSDALAQRYHRNQRYREKERARVRAWSRANRDRIAKIDGRSYLRHREKKLAGNRLRRAVRIGLVLRPASCSRCGMGGRIQGHHHDYTRPLEVEWLCSACHGKEHRRYREDEVAVEGRLESDAVVGGVTRRDGADEDGRHVP